MRRSNNAMRAAVIALALGVMLGACSEYFDRRETISKSGGDAMASNRVTHMVDPWPAASANRNIPHDGKKMQGAVERYRENRVTPPSGSGTSAAYQQAPQQGGGAAPIGPTVTQPAAPVK